MMTIRRKKRKYCPALHPSYFSNYFAKTLMIIAAIAMQEFMGLNILTNYDLKIDEELIKQKV
jgi:hypothetical protein